VRLQARLRYQATISGTHPAKMLPAIAGRAIATYSAPGDLVCDPMAGIGSTLVEAVHLDRDAIDAITSGPGRSSPGPTCATRRARALVSRLRGSEEICRIGEFRPPGRVVPIVSHDGRQPWDRVDGRRPSWYSAQRSA